MPERMKGRRGSFFKNVEATEKDKQDSAGEFPEHPEGSSVRALSGKGQCQSEVARE